MSDRIEFYKNRSIGERFSVAVDFLKQNWKVLYKNIMWGGLPLALLMSFLSARMMSVRPVAGVGAFSDLYGFLLTIGLLSVVSFLIMLYLYSMTGAVLLHYDRNQLTETTGWGSLQATFFKLVGKTFLITLILYLLVIIITAIFAVIMVISGFGAVTGGQLSGSAAVLIVFSVLLLLGICIVFIPFFTIIYFPAYFSGKSVWKSITIAFKLGFKNWGSLFVAFILTLIVFIVIYMIFSGPLQLVSLFATLGGINVSYITYFLLAILSSIGTILSYPIMIVIFAFQYFSIVESEEGVSLQSKVSDFENL